MIEEIILGLVGLVFAGRNEFSWEEVIGISLGSAFVIMVLLTVGHFMPGQEENLSCFMRMMVFGYLPMRVFSCVGEGSSME